MYKDLIFKEGSNGITSLVRRSDEDPMFRMYRPNGSRDFNVNLYERNNSVPCDQCLFPPQKKEPLIPFSQTDSMARMEREREKEAKKMMAVYEAEATRKPISLRGLEDNDSASSKWLKKMLEISCTD